MATRGPNRVLLGSAFVLPFLIVGGLLLYDRLAQPSCTPLDAKAIGRDSFDTAPCEITSRDYLYLAAVETTAGPVNLVLDPILAPRVVNNFVFLSEAGFYDGIVIHKVEATEDHSFVQIGDRTGTGRGTAGYTFTADYVSPQAQYPRGTAAWVFSEDDPSTASSQFFVVVDDYEGLSFPARQPIYPVFAKVTDPESLRTLDVIVAERPGSVSIQSVTITQRLRFTGGTEATTEPFTPATPSPTPSRT